MTTDYRFWQLSEPELANSPEFRIFDRNQYYVSERGIYNPMTNSWLTIEDYLLLSPFDPLIARYIAHAGVLLISIEQLVDQQWQVLTKLDDIEMMGSITFAPYGIWYYRREDQLYIYRFEKLLTSVKISSLEAYNTYRHQRIIVRLQTKDNYYILRVWFPTNNKRYLEVIQISLDLLNVIHKKYDLAKVYSVDEEGNYPPTEFLFRDLDNHPHLISADGQFIFNCWTNDILDMNDFDSYYLPREEYKISQYPFTWQNELKIIYSEHQRIQFFGLYDAKTRQWTKKITNSLGLSYDSQCSARNVHTNLYTDIMCLHYKLSPLMTVYINFKLEQVRVLDIRQYNYKENEPIPFIIVLDQWLKIKSPNDQNNSLIFIFDQFRLELADLYADEESIEIRNRYLLWLAYTRPESHLQALPPEMVDAIGKQI